MKHFFAAFILLIGISGCSGLNQQFVSTVDTTWSIIGPEYREYVQEDESLSEHSREIRLKTAEDFDELIEEAKNEGN